MLGECHCKEACWWCGKHWVLHRYNKIFRQVSFPWPVHFWFEIHAAEENQPCSCLPHSLSCAWFKQGHHYLQVVAQAENALRNGNDPLHQMRGVLTVEAAKSMDVRYQWPVVGLKTCTVSEVAWRRCSVSALAFRGSGSLDIMFTVVNWLKAIFKWNLKTSNCQGQGTQKPLLLLPG